MIRTRPTALHRTTPPAASAAPAVTSRAPNRKGGAAATSTKPALARLSPGRAFPSEADDQLSVEIVAGVEGVAVAGSKLPRRS